MSADETRGAGGDLAAVTWGTRESGHTTNRRDRKDAEEWASMGGDRGREVVAIVPAAVLARLADHGATERVGFIGPLPQDAPDRCPLCGLDPADDTLHADWCLTVTNDLCGVIKSGRMCLRRHSPDSPEWVREHQWATLADFPDHGATGDGQAAVKALDEVEREHRREWAAYIQSWEQAVGPKPPTVQGIVAALLLPHPPFGCSAAVTTADDAGRHE